MNEAVEPSPAARVCARVLSVLQIIVLGPITLVSTLASTLLCFSCICVKIKKDYPSFRDGFRTVFSNCMSTWGIIWMVREEYYPKITLITLILTLFLIFPSPTVSDHLPSSGSLPRRSRSRIRHRFLVDLLSLLFLCASESKRISLAGSGHRGLWDDLSLLEEKLSASLL
jgi:hypothetical protein